MSEQEVFDALKYRIEVDSCGTRRYYDKADQLHRTNGPAIEYTDGTKRWYQRGQKHRTDGPAVEYTNGYLEWWLNDKQMFEAEFLAATQPVVEMTVADIEKLLGKRVKIIK